MFDFRGMGVIGVWVIPWLPGVLPHPTIVSSSYRIPEPRSMLG